MYEGHAAVRQLECDPDAGTLLEERIRPGVLLSTLDTNSEATAIAASVLRHLWHPSPPDHTFPISNADALPTADKATTNPPPRLSITESDAQPNMACLLTTNIVGRLV